MSFRWGTSKEYKEYSQRMRKVGTVSEEEIIASMGQSRTGSEHTAADDAKWHQPKVEGQKVLVVDLDTWKLTGANHGALFFERCAMPAK